MGGGCRGTEAREKVGMPLVENALDAGPDIHSEVLGNHPEDMAGYGRKL